MKAVTLLSGGLDSTTLAYHLKDKDPDLELICLSFDYGQRHGDQELVAAENIAQLLGAEHHIVHFFTGPSDAYREELTGGLNELLPGSALTDERVPVPDGHYAEDNMKQTVVPNRNAIMLSIAYGVAVARGAELVAFAAHSGDRAQYPDCTPEFVAALDTALRVGNAWPSSDQSRSVPTVVGPFLDWDKARIAAEASKLGVPIERTWSCYKGSEIHCGRCGTCVERREAFDLAGVADPTEYADPDYWKKAVEDYASANR